MQILSETSFVGYHAIIITMHMEDFVSNIANHKKGKVQIECYFLIHGLHCTGMKCPQLYILVLCFIP